MDLGATFDILFAKNVPHILEKIFLSLDNKSFESCMNVNKTWRELLSTRRYQNKLEEVLAEKKKNGEKLWYSSRFGSAGEVESITSNLVVDVNFAFGFDRSTPLIEAAKSGKDRVVKILLKKGADIEKKSDLGKLTPLGWAAFLGNTNVVNTLLAGGAEVDKADSMGSTPLFKAAQNGHQDVVKVLLERGAKPNLVDQSGYTPLHMAAFKKRASVIKPLIKGGADPNKEDKWGRTPLQQATIWDMPENRGVVKELLEGGADPEKNGWCRDNQKWIPN